MGKEGQEEPRWPVFRRVLDLLILISMVVWMVIFFSSENACIKTAGVGNLFFILWIIMGDPLNTKIRLGNRSFIEFLLSAIAIWGFAFMFHASNMCSSLTEMLNAFSKYF